MQGHAMLKQTKLQKVKVTYSQGMEG